MPKIKAMFETDNVSIAPYKRRTDGGANTDSLRQRLIHRESEQSYVRSPIVELVIDGDVFKSGVVVAAGFVGEQILSYDSSDTNSQYIKCALDSKFSSASDTNILKAYKHL